MNVLLGWRGILLLSVFLMAANGCADSAPVDNRDGNGPEDPDTGLPPVNGECEGICYQLAWARESVSASFQEDVPLQARLTTLQGGDPMPNVRIDFELIAEGSDTAGGSTLMSRSGTTASSGVADVRLRTGQTAASFFIRATFSDSANNPLADPADLRVFVFPKTKGVMQIRVTYANETYRDQLGVHLYVFAQTPQRPRACATLEVQESNVESWNLHNGMAEWESFAPGVPHTFEVMGLDHDQSYTVLALGIRDQGMGSRVTVAAACDNGPDSTRIVGGLINEVELSLEDLMPHYLGDYYIDSTFDFVAMLPDHVETRFREFGNFFQNPAGQVLIWLNPIIDEYLGLQIPAGWLDAVATILNSFLTLLPDWAQAIFVAGTDIYHNLTEVEISSKLSISQQPQPSADVSQPDLLIFPDGSVNQVWDRIIFFWRQNCMEGIGGAVSSDCGRFPFAFSELGLQPLQGSPRVSVRGYWDMTIEAHELRLAWGELLLAFVERVIFPNLIDPNIRSFEDLVYSWMGGSECLARPNYTSYCCDEFAARVGDPGSFSYTTAKSVCIAGVPVVVGELKGMLLGQDVVTGNNFLIGTADAAGFSDMVAPEDRVACRLYDQNYNLTIDKMGLPNDPCKWRAGIRVGNLPLDLVEADFYGCQGTRCPQ